MMRQTESSRTDQYGERSNFSVEKWNHAREGKVLMGGQWFVNVCRERCEWGWSQTKSENNWSLSRHQTIITDSQITGGEGLPSSGPPSRWYLSPWLSRDQIEPRKPIPQAKEVYPLNVLIICFLTRQFKTQHKAMVVKVSTRKDKEAVNEEWTKMSAWCSNQVLQCWRWSQGRQWCVFLSWKLQFLMPHHIRKWLLKKASTVCVLWYSEKPWVNL